MFWVDDNKFYNVYFVRIKNTLIIFTEKSLENLVLLYFISLQSKLGLVIAQKLLTNLMRSNNEESHVERFNSQKFFICVQQ